MQSNVIIVTIEMAIVKELEVRFHKSTGQQTNYNNIVFITFSALKSIVNTGFLYYELKFVKTIR